MHGVRDVQATFADHGLRLTVTERNRVATSLLPTRYVRAVRCTPALGTPPPSPATRSSSSRTAAGSAIFRVISGKLQRAVGGKRILPLSSVSTRHDNVFILYPAGAPRNLVRLRRILQDI
jgi:hypothetical protein